MNPHYRQKRIARDDTSCTEPDELYRRKVGFIGWNVLGLRFDVPFTHKELSCVFDQHNDYAERTILPRPGLVSCVQMMHVSSWNHMPCISTNLLQRVDGTMVLTPLLYEIAARCNLDTQDSAIPSPDNEPAEQLYTFSG